MLEKRFKQDMEGEHPSQIAAAGGGGGNMAALMQAGRGAGRMIRPAREIDEHTPLAGDDPGRGP